MKVRSIRLRMKKYVAIVRTYVGLGDKVVMRNNAVIRSTTHGRDFIEHKLFHGGKKKDRKVALNTCMTRLYSSEKEGGTESAPMLTNGKTNEQKARDVFQKEYTNMRNLRDSAALEKGVVQLGAFGTYSLVDPENAL